MNQNSDFIVIFCIFSIDHVFIKISLQLSPYISVSFCIVKFCHKLANNWSLS